MSSHLKTTARTVNVEDGLIIVDGSIGPLTMTPAAACETARRLLDAAEMAEPGSKDGNGTAAPDPPIVG